MKKFQGNPIIYFFIVTVVISTVFTSCALLDWLEDKPEYEREEEKKLYNLIMEYRAEKGLPVIPMSKSLNYVAKTHVKDLHKHFDLTNVRNCNSHSWSNKGRWTACCYSPDHSNAACMWNKPRELTSYKGNGYELVYTPGGATSWKSDQIKAEKALSAWKYYRELNAVILNDSISQDQWKAIGIGVYKEYVSVWFGKEPDE